MPSFTSWAQLENILRQLPAADLAAYVRSARSRQPEGLTFLSHSSKDERLLPAVVAVLEAHGARVYLDDLDPELSTARGRTIADILRARIKACRKFIVLATDNVRASRWVPWELGLSDGHKTTYSTAIFPAVQIPASAEWVRLEYLGAYDRIVWGEQEGRSGHFWMVWNQETNNAIPLNEWLAR